MFTGVYGKDIQIWDIYFVLYNQIIEKLWKYGSMCINNKQ